MVSFSLSSAQNFDITVNKYSKLPLTTENVASAIIELKIKNPIFVFKQTVKESGYNSDKTGYRSRLALVGNNLFGMRVPKKRKTFCLGEKCYGYAKYSHWIFSIIDYKLWENCVEYRQNETFVQYLIRRHYAGNTVEYVKTLNNHSIQPNIMVILMNNK